MGKRVRTKSADVASATYTKRCCAGVCFSLQLLVAVAVGVLWTAVLWARFSHHLKFDRPGRSEMDELQSPISDSAFYLSYYYDVVRAPTLWEGLQRLLWDTRSEAPDVVNALHKFNVAPELAVNALHRLLGVGSPFAFYVGVLVCFTGFGSALLAFTASMLGGSPMCGLISALLYFVLCFGPSMQAATRLGGSSMALREHWGVPALLLQHMWLSAAVAAPGGSPPIRLLLLCAGGTCILELCWQFAPFVLLLQLLAVLGAHTLGSLSRRRLGEVSLAAAAGTCLALTLSFGNRMLLCSPFFALAGSCSVMSLAPVPSWLRADRTAASNKWVAESAWVLVAALVLGALTQKSLAMVASEQEDRHVMQLLLQKLGLAPPEASFDAFLYLQAPEFQFLDMKFVHEAVQVMAVPSAGLSAVLILFAWTRSTCRRGSTTLLDEELREPAWLVQVLFLVALILLAILVNRLRVLAAPMLCVVGSLTASPDLWSAVLGQGRGRRVLALLTGHGLSLFLTAATLRSALGAAGEGDVIKRVKQVGAFQEDLDMKELVMWANESLPKEALVMADMTLAAKIRMISPEIRVGNHPQYESMTSRQRNRDYYRTFSCAPPHRVHKVLAKYGVTHVVLNLNACRARMGKLDSFMKKSDKCRSTNTDELQQKTFCWGGFLSEVPHSSGSAPFQLVYRNPIYTVLRLGHEPASDAVHAPAHWMETSTWRSWLPGLQGTMAARGLARAAVSWPKKQGAGRKGALEMAELQLRRAEILAPDDPIVVLMRGEFKQISGDAQGAFDTMAKAADLAAGTALNAGAAKRAADPESLYQVFLAWKGHLNQRGHQAKRLLQNLAASLRPYLKATHNSFDMCDLGSWLKDWGEQKQSSKLWEAAKRDPYDSCVREDWSRWEGMEMTERELWRAFLRF